MKKAEHRASTSYSPLGLRQRAESRIPQDNNFTSSMAELLQELREHQIELEMQNEALRHTQLELEQALNRYISLYDFSPVGYNPR